MPYNQWSDTNWAAFIIREEPHNSNTPSAHRKVLSANPTVNAAQESHTTWGSALKKMHFAVQLDQTTALFQDDTVLITVLASWLSLIPQPFFMSLYPPPEVVLFAWQDAKTQELTTLHPQKTKHRRQLHPTET